jgi:hypothetical protein
MGQESRRKTFTSVEYMAHRWTVAERFLYAR